MFELNAFALIMASEADRQIIPYPGKKVWRRTVER